MARKNNKYEKLIIAAIISLIFLGVKAIFKNSEHGNNTSTNVTTYSILSSLLFLGALGAYSMDYKEYAVAIFIVFVVMVLFCISDEKENSRKAIEREQTINNIIQKHIDTLKLKYSQLVYYDDYGVVQDKKFYAELNYFINNVISPEINITDEERKRIITKISYQCDDDSVKSIKDKENPYDFEKKCAQILNNNGWNAKATSKSLDQGVDVVASKYGKTVAIQCKLYSNPVGNKAVQEVVAGKNYYHADYAVVVSNNTYTESARQLAKNCDVLLLFEDDLKNLDTLLGM